MRGRCEISQSLGSVAVCLFPRLGTLMQISTVVDTSQVYRYTVPFGQLAGVGGYVLG
jgi:hypothetical protein